MMKYHPGYKIIIGCFILEKCQCTTAAVRSCAWRMLYNVYQHVTVGVLLTFSRQFGQIAAWILFQCLLLLIFTSFLSSSITATAAASWQLLLLLLLLLLPLLLALLLPLLLALLQMWLRVVRRPSLTATTGWILHWRKSMARFRPAPGGLSPSNLARCSCVQASPATHLLFYALVHAMLANAGRVKFALQDMLTV
jgi:hypothetical protein